MEFEALNSGIVNDANESHMMDMGDVEHRDDLRYNHDPSSGAESVLEPCEGMEFESEGCQGLLQFLCSSSGL